MTRAARPAHLMSGGHSPRVRTPSPQLAMRIALHPAVLLVQLAGLLIWAWSLVDVVSTWHWYLWIAVDCATTAFVAGRETNDRS